MEAKVYKSGDGNTLSFDNDAGKWCIGESCIDVNGAATPVQPVCRGPTTLRLKRLELGSTATTRRDLKFKISVTDNPN